MPYKVYKNGDQFCVHKKNPDGSKGDLIKGGCHSDSKKALAQMRAIYASENKEITSEDEIIEEMEDKEYAEEASRLPADYTFARSFAELEAERDIRERANDLSALVKDFQSMMSNIIYTGMEKGNDRIKALDNLFSEFKERAQTLVDGEDEEKEIDEELEEELDDEEKAKRADVSAADKKRATAKYGDVTYADETNKKYPIDTEEHIRAAWNYIRMPKNAKKYSDGGAAIKRRIIAAWKKKIDSAGPPAAQKKDLLDTLKDIGEAIMNLFKEDKEIDESGLTIWKEGEVYWWMARYSNNFRDNDNPPEIISSDSHKRFVELVKEGKAPMPELWLWHKKNWKVGQAHDIAYDDSGFAVAIGTFDADKHEVAEALMNSKEGIKVSHGMPYSSIKRDQDDPTIIVEHETREISPLPAWAAANKLTGFVVLNLESKEDKNMGIPDETKKEWIDKLGIKRTTLDSLEQANAADADKATKEGLESKEVEETEVSQPATEETETETPTEPEEEAKSVESVTLTVDQLRESVQEAVKGIVSPLIERLDAMEGSIKQIKEASDARDEALKGTPTASLNALLGQFAQSAIGANETKVDGRTSLAQSKPKETAALKENRTLVPFINDLLDGNATQ